MFKDEFYTNILKMFSGTVGSHILWAAAMLAVARLYAPEYFGEGQLFVSAASILSVVATGRYEMAIVIPRFRFQAMNIFLFSLLLSLFGAVLLFPILFVFSDAIVQKLGFSAEISFLLPFYVLELCLYVLCYAWLIREKKYAITAKGLLLFPAAYLVFCLAFYYIWLPVHKLVLATMLSRGLEILYYGYFVCKGMKSLWPKISWQQIWQYGKMYVDFPKYMLMGNFIDSATQHMVPFFVTTFWGLAATGYYSMATQVLAAPAGLIAKSVGSVFQQEGSRLYGKYRECKAFYVKNLKICMGYSTVICICMYLAVLTVVPLLMGEKWNVAGYYVQLMLPMTFVTLVSTPLSNMYVIARRQKTYLGIQTAKFLGSAISLYFVGWIGYGIEMALLIWGLAVMIISGISIYGGKKIAEGSFA